MEKKFLTLVLFLCFFNCKRTSDTSIDAHKIIKEFMLKCPKQDNVVYEVLVKEDANRITIFISKSEIPLFVDYPFKVDTINENLVIQYSSDSVSQNRNINKYVESGLVSLEPIENQELFKERKVIISDKKKYRVISSEEYYNTPQNSAP